jgi:hypothetical protein
MSRHDQLKGDSLSWLLESDSAGVRYLALRDLGGGQRDGARLESAREAAYSTGAMAGILKRMHSQGYWIKAGAGYSPKYRSTVWSLILLAQLGAHVTHDKRIARACAYYLDHALLPGGQISNSDTPASTIDCLQGNMLWALVTMGFDDERLDKAYEWMARTVTGEGIAPLADRKAEVRYFAHKCGPLFACGANKKLPCAWGGTKVMQAFSVWPAKKRTPLIRRAIQQGADFLLDADPATANYPSGHGGGPSSDWWKFGFPVYYVTDILQIAEALVALGYAKDRRLANTLDLIRAKQDSQGRWALEYDYAGKTRGNFGRKNEPNPWVTLRALRVLKAIH